MNIGIIIYSQTGNTLSVAQRMQETCTAAGHTVELRQITITSEAAGDRVVLADTPATQGFDALIFGAPVQAFSLCRAMKLYLKQIDKIKDIPVGYFITHALPKLWMGGNSALKSMHSLCLHKGGKPVPLGHIYWKSDERDEEIAEVVSAAAKFAATAKPRSENPGFAEIMKNI